MPKPKPKPGRGGARPGAGRPTLPETRESRLVLRVLPAELDRLRAAAAAAGVSVSELVREKLSDLL